MTVQRMRIAHVPTQVVRQPRAVAIGTFDGVHRGHRGVIQAAIDTGLAPTVLTFDPHPRSALGNRVELISTLERRLELLGEAGVETTLIAPFTQDFMLLSPERFAEQYLHGIGAEVVIAGEDFRFGHRRSGDLSLLEGLGFEVMVAPQLPNASSSAIRRALKLGDIALAASMLGRPPELDGVVVGGDQRGGTLGFPTANIQPLPELVVPQYGIYAGQWGAFRAAVSIGTNPHYGSTEQRIEAFLLDFSGDLYGKRLVVELWEYLRGEQTFDSEQRLIDQIAADVAATRAAVRPR